MTEGPYALPPGWRWVELGEVAVVFSGPWGEEPTGGRGYDRAAVRAVRVADIDPTLTIRYTAVPVRLVSRTQAARLALRGGDVVVVKSSGSKPHMIPGRAALFQEQPEVFIPSDFVFAVRPAQRVVQGHYLWYALNSRLARQYIEQTVSTFTYPNLKKSDYVKLPLPLPPLGAQEEIVAYLDGIRRQTHALAEAQGQLDTDLQCLEQSILDRAFRGEL